MKAKILYEGPLKEANSEITERDFFGIMTFTLFSSVCLVIVVLNILCWAFFFFASSL